MRVRWLVAVCAFVVLCGTPLASARVQALPGDFSFEATGTNTPVTFDNAGFHCVPASGDLFPLGPTTVNCDDRDCSHWFVHSDGRRHTGPAISGMPADQSVSTGSPPVAVSWTAPSATDLVDGAVSVNCSPSSGSDFSSGATPVTCSATDATGNSS